MLNLPYLVLPYQKTGMSSTNFVLAIGLAMKMERHAAHHIATMSSSTAEVSFMQKCHFALDAESRILVLLQWFMDSRFHGNDRHKIDVKLFQQLGKEQAN